MLSRIEDVLHADQQTQVPSQTARKSVSRSAAQMTVKAEKGATTPKEEAEKGGSETPSSMTLLDFMGWEADQGDAEAKKDVQVSDDLSKDQKLPNVATKKVSYLENLGGVRSPTSRH